MNIGSAEEISIHALAERVKESTGSDLETVLVHYDEADGESVKDMKRRVPDIGKLGMRWGGGRRPRLIAPGRRD